MLVHVYNLSRTTGGKLVTPTGFGRENTEPGARDWEGF